MTNNWVPDVYRKWTVEVAQYAGKNARRYHLHVGSEGTGFFDTRVEARRSAKALRGNYGWTTRVRRYSATA